VLVPKDQDPSFSVREEQQKEPKTLVDVFFVLTANHDGGERVWSVESTPERAIAALKLARNGRVVRMPQMHQWATYQDPNVEAEELPSVSMAYEKAKAEGKLGEFVSQNDL
jgi:hypothetical protein